MQLEFDIPTIMMSVFLFTLIVSIWKIYPFFLVKRLKDDDTTAESQEELLRLIRKHIKDENLEGIDTKVLLEKIKNDEEFDKEHFWRFNQNKLNNLLKKLQ